MLLLLLLLSIANYQEVIYHFSLCRKLYQISLSPFALISGCADGREHAYSIHKRSRNFNVYSFNKKKTVLVPSNKAMF